MTASIHSRFTNPSTAIAYRLVIDNEHWRITRTRIDKDTVRLSHLRGCSAPGYVPIQALREFVRGQPVDVTSGEPQTAFAGVVLEDLLVTAERLLRQAHEARQCFEHGQPGFRPGCHILRDRLTSARSCAIVACREMASVWNASGLRLDRVLPGWFRFAALHQEQASRAAYRDIEDCLLTMPFHADANADQAGCIAAMDSDVQRLTG